VACLVLLVGAAALRVWDPHPVQEIRVRTWDYFQLFQPRVKTIRPVVIVDIDEKSLADSRLGQWPWPRTRIADIVTNLTKLGAVVIAFDAVFSEPDRLNPDIAVLDISMPGLTGIEAARQLVKLDVKVVFLTVHDDPDYLRSALATGAIGYVMKDRLATDLVPALREALAGRQFVSPSPSLESVTGAVK
jgi:CHASE2 domain-containing sensor protein